MTVLAYSELVKRIMNIDEKKLEAPFKILSRLRSTPHRLAILKELARSEQSTIGKLLQKTKHNKGGGSYLAIQSFFNELEKEGLLKKTKENKKTVWMFTPEYTDLREFIVR